MTKALKTLRAVQWSMLASILLYGYIGELAGRSVHAIDPTVSYIFTTLGVAIVGVIFVVRRTLVLRAAESLAVHPEDNLSLNQWRTGYFATYALCEALALFGLILRFMGGGFQQSVPYYIGGFILLFFFRPQEPVAAAVKS
jgi:F0F1-type ATP synthase membrane subunit c/vacuolar-type H+-ATPase subunit K